MTAVDADAVALRHTVRRTSLREGRGNGSSGGHPRPAETPTQRHTEWKDALRRSWLVDDRIAREALFDGNGPASALHFADFPAGHHIYTEGQPAEHIYVIISGIVKITCAVAHGRHVVRALMGAGDVLDELTIFNAAPRSGTATCQSLVRTAWLNSSSLHRLIARRPQLAQQWLPALARELRSRDQELVSLRSTDLPERVARRLIELAQRFGESTDGPESTDGRVQVTHSLTRREFAQLVGSTTEATSKVLANFVERGWIITAPGGYEIIDAERLRLRARMPIRNDNPTWSEPSFPAPGAHRPVAS